MPIDIASGIVELKFDEVALPGKIPLVWDRYYSVALLDRHSKPLGQGWTNRYFSTLTKNSEGFEFITAKGGIAFIADPKGKVDGGGVSRNSGTFLEVFKISQDYFIQSWNIDTGEVWRYRFASGERGKPWRLRSIEDVTGQAVDLIWDSTGLLAAIKQRLEDRTIVLSYTHFGLVDRVSLHSDDGKASILTQYEYDVNQRVVAAYDAAGNADRYEYDQSGRIARQIMKGGEVFDYRYDEKGRCVRYSGQNSYDEKRLRFLDATGHVEVTDSTGGVRTYKCLPSGQIATETAPTGFTRTTEYDDIGRIVQVTDEVGGVTKYSYDAAGNRDSVTNALGFTYRLTYNATHLPETMTDPLGGVWQRRYDSLNRLITTTDASGATWRYMYDPESNLVQVINPMGASKTFTFYRGSMLSGTDWSGNRSQYGFDQFGRLVEKIDPMGLSTRLEYDRVGNLVAFNSPDGRVFEGRYDADGNLVAFVGGDGERTSYIYGPCKRLMEKIETDGSTQKYRWSTEPDRLDEILNEKEETYRFVRDEVGNVIEEIGFDGRSIKYRFDGTGSCIAMVNGNGEEITLNRDPLGRVIRRIEPDGQVTTYSYDPAGNMRSAENSHIKLLFDRDPAGRVIREVQGQDWVRTYYNAAGHVVRTETSLGEQVDYAVNSSGQVTGITCVGSSIRINYDAKGMEIDRHCPGDKLLRSTYDPAGRLLEQCLSKESVAFHNYSTILPSPLVLRQYKYDAAGSLIACNDSHWGRKDYEYNARNRLRSVQGNFQLLEAFEYDLTGNIVKIARSKGDVTTLEYTRGDRLQRARASVYRFDPQGQMVGRDQVGAQGQIESWEYRWNAVGQLVSLKRPDGEQWEYAYDPLGRRLEKIKNGKVDTRFLWARRHLIHEVKQGSHTSWIFGRDGLAPLARIDNRGLAAVICDHLGTPIAFVGERIGVARAPRLTAFGELEGSDARADVCNLKFQGYYFDEESGLHCSRFRYYSPEIGRFVQQDPIGWVGGLNLYAYTINPINFIDPFGLSTSSDSKKLGDNLGTAGQGPQGDDEAAHHIVMSNSQKGGMPDLRATMGKFDPPIDVNDPKNGIYLPRNADTREKNDPDDTRTAHQGEGLHSDAYKQHVYDKLTKQPPPVTREEFLKRLAEIKEELEQGKTFPCKR